MKSLAIFLHRAGALLRYTALCAAQHALISSELLLQQPQPSHQLLNCALRRAVIAEPGARIARVRIRGVASQSRAPSLCSLFSCFHLPSRPVCVSRFDIMPITEQEAVAWTGAQSANELVPFPTERLTFRTIRPVLDFSTSVVHCFVYGGPTPPLFWDKIRTAGTRISAELLNCCHKVIERDSSKRKMCDEAASQDHVAIRATKDEGSFRRTFGDFDDVASDARMRYPFMQVGDSVVVETAS